MSNELTNAFDERDNIVTAFGIGSDCADLVGYVVATIDLVDQCAGLTIGTYFYKQTSTLLTRTLDQRGEIQR